MFPVSILNFIETIKSDRRFAVQPAIFIYDGFEGGIGLTKRAT